MIKCFPSDRIISLQEYWYIYNKILLEKEQYWDQFYLGIDE